jgi:MurNAc alpha-1-phosphate uridylyltransferase
MQQPVRTAMFLAAGLGTRMRPLSLTTPKPLIPAAGMPLMDHLLEAAIEAGIERAIVNVHYLAEQVEAHMATKTGIEIIISDERAELLETGGAIVKARDLLGTDPVFMVNTDAFWVNARHNPFTALSHAYNPETMDDLLLLAETRRSIGYAGKGDFNLHEDGRITRRDPKGTTPYAYAGARITKASLYDGEDEHPFSANVIWNRSLEAGRLYGLPLDAQWMHVGDPEAIIDTENWIERHLAK